MPPSTHTREYPAYQYNALNGDDIRIIQLQPGQGSQTLHAKIAHVPLKLPPASSEKDLIPVSVIDKYLPAGWRSFRTPEGRLFYQNMGDTKAACQYTHPLPGLVPKKHSAILEPELKSQSESLELEVDSEGRYEALSYCWGHPTPQDELYVKNKDDTTATSKIVISANLGSALRHLRHEQEPRMLWVDAVCINQDDYAEKDQQVLRIPNVYRSAWRVIAWLGDASYDSKLALNTLHYLGGQIEISRSMWVHGRIDATEKRWISPVFKLPYSQEEWEALESLLERPWFTRLWVLQEITLANPNAMVQCGHDVITYSRFRRAVVALRSRTGMPDFLHDLIEDNHILPYGMQNTGLWNLISLAREHACSIDHDKVYGLLGFIGRRIRDTIRPSYQTPFMQVCKEIFLAHSRSTDRLELMAYCSLAADNGFPSWVPDWRSHGDQFAVAPAPSTLAAGMSQADFYEVRAGELEVSGIIHDAVASTFKVLSSRGGDRVGTWLRELRERFMTSTTYPTGETTDEAFARVLCTNDLRERHPQTHGRYKLKQWQVTLDELMNRRSSEIPDDSDLEGFVKSRWGYWERRKFFQTEGGYLGLGPVDMLEGDEVCVFLGFYSPMVTRSTGDGKFKIIGGCYLHGLMDGEALLGQLPDHYTVQQSSMSGRPRRQYHNANTGEATAEDPRLGPLDPHWQRIHRGITADDPETVDFFGNNGTGEIINYDPRLTKTALEQRGVKLQSISLV